MLKTYLPRESGATPESRREASVWLLAPSVICALVSLTLEEQGGSFKEINGVAGFVFNFCHRFLL